MHDSILIFGLRALFLAKNALATTPELFPDTTLTEECPYSQGHGNFTTNNYLDTVSQQGMCGGNR